jgi:hypothetical protein
MILSIFSPKNFSEKIGIFDSKQKQKTPFLGLGSQELTRRKFVLSRIFLQV